jgi:hypothetical protein
MLRLRHPVSLLVIFVLVLLGVLRSYSPPSPVGADAPDVVFSASRAEAILGELLQENVPHVAGSPHNQVVRDRIIAQLEAAGYKPEVQSRFHCSPIAGSCSPVENIIAVKPGSSGGAAVMLTAHYDSVWAGPGAADDGAGMSAVLEIARMAADFPPFQNDIVFLISDSEENGLIGADAFARHHPLFEKVKAVINLEARGVTGPSAMFETGEGNRSIIRMFSKNVQRPVANSLTYEVYKRMPNDTDYSVYKRAGVMGLNFAFTQGVAVYHSQIDDIERLDLGSLQHHGDNAWAMLNALAERDLDTIEAREDAGYIDVFGSRLIHYPVSITGGLALFLGVWVMIAIGLAFRKDFRFRQLRWGVVAIPFLLLSILLGGYVVSWPLGHWPDMHALEHPYPWAGRSALFLVLILAGYSTLRIFSGKVSACAWMMIAWGVIFVSAILLTGKLPAASHIALLPLAMFALGSVVDLFRKKSPAPLLLASVLGFAATVFIALYHYFMSDVVMNFDLSHIKILPFWLAGLAVMPMLLAFVKDRDLTWQPAKWLLGGILALCAVHMLLPGFTADRPRDMNLMYSEVDGHEKGHVVLESNYRQHDRGYAKGHSFEMTEIQSARSGRVHRPAREVTALNLPGITLEQQPPRSGEEGWRRDLRIRLPESSPVLWLIIPLDAGLQKAWVNGELALDTSVDSKYRREFHALRLLHPGPGPVSIELLTQTAHDIAVTAVTWHALPAVLVAPFMGNWPDDARPAHYGQRAEKIQKILLSAAAAVSPPDTQDR